MTTLDLDEALSRAETAERERDEARAQAAANRALLQRVYDADCAAMAEPCELDGLDAFEGPGIHAEYEAAWTAVRAAIAASDAGAPLLAEMARLRAVEKAARGVCDSWRWAPRAEIVALRSALGANKKGTPQ